MQKTGEIYILSRQYPLFVLKITEIFIDIFPMFQSVKIDQGRGSASFWPAEGPLPASSHPALPLPGGAGGAAGGAPTSVKTHGKTSHF